MSQKNIVILVVVLVAGYWIWMQSQKSKGGITVNVPLSEKTDGALPSGSLTPTNPGLGTVTKFPGMENVPGRIVVPSFDFEV